MKYPPCNMNPMTEKSYRNHRWEIPEGASVIARKTKTGETVYYYRVRCSRCGFNDPHAPLH